MQRINEDIKQQNFKQVYLLYGALSAEQLAEIRGRSVEEIHQITVENGKRLYRID